MISQRIEIVQFIYCKVQRIFEKCKHFKFTEEKKISVINLVYLQNQQF